MTARNSFVFSPVGKFLIAATIGGALLLLGAVLLVGPVPGLPMAAAFGLCAYFMACFIAANRLSNAYPHAELGLCNIATLGRLVIVAVLATSLIAKTPPSWAAFALAVLALCLDGIDGWLARKQGLASDFGARFDVEVDAAFALVLAALAASSGAAGPYIIVLGLPYYAFVAAKAVWPWLDKPLPESFSRKAVCVFQISALTALQVPLFAGGQLGPIALAVTAALLWSFGRDILWLWHRRA